MVRIKKPVRTVDSEAGTRSAIKKLEQQLADAERQVPSDLTELRKIYAMTLVQKLPANVTSISHDRASWVTVQQLAVDDAFDKIIEASNITMLAATCVGR